MDNQEYLDKLAVLYEKVFSTTEGKDVLIHLKKRFRKPSLVPPSAMDGMAFALLTQMRIGEANVIDHIDAMIERANQPQQKKGKDNE